MNFQGQNIRNLSKDELIEKFKNIGEQKFRANQTYEWLWTKGETDFDKMHNLPKALREKLKQEFFIDRLIISHKVKSKIDGTVKLLFESYDNKLFEGVLIPSRDRTTACFSTQIGCPLRCTFCATGKLGFTRDLTAGEIYEQAFKLNELSNLEYNRNLSNIVIMGMGEPLLNYENTMHSVNIICSEEGLAMSPQRITLSTSGEAKIIKELADSGQKINLSISLHSADNTKRTEIMPINNKYNLDALKDAIIYYYKKTGKRITYEYLLLGDFNDSIADAKKLTEFTKISPCKVNLIEYNPSENDIFKKPEDDKIKLFMNFIESKNIVVTLRHSKGQDIDAACGQLANKISII